MEKVFHVPFCKVDFHGLHGDIFIQHTEHVTLYRIEWPDGSRDWLFKENGKWHAESMLNESELSFLGSHIDAHFQ